MSRRAKLLTTAAVLACSFPLLRGCHTRTDVTSIEKAGRITVYEGLPHQMYEKKALEEETRSKPTVSLHGFAFYREPLAVDAGGVAALKKVITDPGTLAEYSGEKKCGGFHPDYAVEWSVGGKVRRILICFGCFEAKIYGPGGGRTHDIPRPARGRLEAVLKPYRKNRPAYSGE